MTQFHELTVTDIHRTIKDAVAVTLRPPAGEEETFRFTQGQYLTFRRDFNGEELRRCYSICAGVDEDRLRIGVKRVEGGAFSNWINDNLKVGDRLQAMPPMGRFFTPLDKDARRHYLAFAGGSGITPVLSIVKTTLQREPLSSFTLVYANRAVGSIMFREELEDLKNRYMDRFTLLHMLKTDAQEIDLFTGRVDREKCKALFAHWIAVEDVDTAFICGPEPMMREIEAALREAGLKEQQIKFELFLSAQPGRLERKATAARAESDRQVAELLVELDGASIQLQAEKSRSILETALENRLDVPYSCRSGVCSTCRCRVVEGEVDMIANHALEDYEVEKGAILACQSYPLSDRVKVVYGR